MAKKKQPSKKPAKRSPGPKSGPAKAAPRGRRRAEPAGFELALESLLDEFNNEPPTLPEGARDLAVDAFDEPDLDDRTRMARAALELWPDCADAFIVLAEDAPGRKEALALFEKAAAAGERALGPERIAEGMGELWLDPEARSYLRALEGLAHSLWTLGRREEAAEQLRELLRLNTGDNQGARYTLASWLLALDRDAELRELLERYPEDASAAWAYTRTLLAFRAGGDTPEARELLAVARRINPHVLDYLLGERPLPLDLPNSYSHGSDSEAILYAAAALGAWKSTPGAVTWLRSAREPTKARKAARKAKAPAAPKLSATARRNLLKLPQSDDTWLVVVGEVPRWIESDAGRIRPWVVVIASRDEGTVLGTSLFEGEPSPAEIWDVLARSFRAPSIGEPARPAAIHAHDHPRWEAIRPLLEGVDIELSEPDEPELLAALFASLTEHLNRDLPPNLAEMPGVTPELVAGFYRAAADFYRRAPWKALGYEEAIRVTCEQFESGPWYAVLMGQSGLTLGLALYEDLDLLRRMWAGEFTDELGARETVALTVTFDQQADVAPGDLDAIEAHGWEVAGPEAYPTVFRKERGLSMRPPLAWELQLLEGCLRAISEFVARHRPGDTSERRMAVPTAAGELVLGLSWIDEG